MEGNARRGMTARELGVLLTARSKDAPSGPRHVDARLLSSWYERQWSTGIPDPLPQRHHPGVLTVRRWDPEVVLAWFLGWTPKKGGAPVGNQNAVRHGGFRGARAVRAAREAARGK